jgi:hypothetical protein
LRKSGKPDLRGERVGVRGFGSLLIDRAQNRFQHAIGISHHIVVPESHNEVTHHLQDFGSVGVTLAI